ncbi:SurA N-terminal domain-containing protein [Thalassomonas sp. M1454]|uniref:SurA N-terminal domain-containing protein n=1 Tax=Thalassomonas sp. M1454 TaxID=2594477 RepID=UPI00117E3BBC|nr:SurA N-terminal domain-containing protein [Thalassomonas sp. M1454]TRX57255.1 peptidylprolyl isomerase [Thalassomonas sp. M1454]
MLERIREGSSGITAKVILGLVIATFVFAGVGTYNNNVDTSVAIVNGDKISQQQFDNAYQNQRNRMQQQYGEMFDQLAGNELYMQNLRTNVLEQQINELLLDQHAAKLNIRVSDEQIKQAILTTPEFQIDGKFDNNRYLMVINQAGFYQATAFRDYLRVDMTRRQLINSIMASEFSLPYQQDIAVKLANQTRDINYATISAEQFKASVDVSEDEVNEYYQANLARFATPEQIKLEYVHLDINALKADVTLAENAVNDYYQDNIDSYSTVERRRASHILIEFADDEAAAKQQAEDILAKIQAGEDFAALAKQHSADTFSGDNGGDLDWFEKGSMDPNFDEAVFALTLDNNLSSVVKTDFGFHIIKLTDLEAVTTQEFAEVKAEITELLKQEQALETFYALQGELAEVAFESPDSLDEAASVVNAEIKQSPWLTRGAAMAPFNAEVISAAFSDDVLLDNLNSEVIEVATDESAMVVRVLEHKPSATQPLTQVSEMIKTQLVSTKAAEQAKQAADSLLAKLVAGEDVSATQFVAVADVPRVGGTIDGNVTKQAFLLAHPTEGVVSAGVAALNNGDYSVVQVTKVTAGVAAETDANLGEQQVMSASQATFEGYIEDLKAQAEITRNLPSNSPQF